MPHFCAATFCCLALRFLPSTHTLGFGMARFQCFLRTMCKQETLLIYESQMTICRIDKDGPLLVHRP